MRVAVIGAGVNGVCAAIALAEKRFQVTVFEAKSPFVETSSKSSKLLHGGIRYLENWHLKLVREALVDRAWWLKNAAEYVKKSSFLYLSIKISQEVVLSYLLVLSYTSAYLDDIL
jgi:glycerol-3-phosphate dehydrogenase